MADDFKYIIIPPELMPKAEDLPGMLRQIAEVVGVEATLKLAQRFRAMSVYFHNVDPLMRKIRDREIRASYDALTSEMSGEKAVARLALKNQLSTRQIKNIVNTVDPEEIADRQMGLWG